MEIRHDVSTRNRPNKEKTAPVPAKRTRRAISMENQTKVVSLPAKRTRRTDSIENESKHSTEVVSGRQNVVFGSQNN